MLQLLQNLKNGDTELTEIPTPKPGNEEILIQSSKSLISLGTEKMLVDFGKSSLYNKAKKQPEKVKQALNKIKTDGLIPTIKAINNKLDTPISLGYSNVGSVIAIGKNVKNINIGDRVVSNGAHAEYVCISKNLVAKIPDKVSDSEATFTIVGAIGLQGIRLVNPLIGESIAVIGLGLIGLLTCQILQANGCQVIGVDIDPKKVSLAQSLGIRAVTVSDTNTITLSVITKNNQELLDGVIITASTTSHEPLDLAASLCRKRGRVVLVGVVGNQWSRNSFYKKELTLQVSCSYGPGRYDSNYESKGLDYPIEHVRFTENRNFQTILTLLEQKKLNINPLISKEISLKDSETLYKNLIQSKNEVGILISYENTPRKKIKTTLKNTNAIKKEISENSISIGFIGAGNYTKCVLLPAIKKLQKKSKSNFQIHLESISSSTGISSHHLGKKYGFSTISSDAQKVLDNPTINTIFITTPHNTHANFVIDALKRNKHVFVEKPLCLTQAELSHIKKTYESSSSHLMIGFNRRFSPHTLMIKDILSKLEAPACFTYTVNAGHIPSDHWTQDPEIGGGRIIGEAVHFIDLLLFLSGSTIVKLSSIGLNNKTLPNDTLSIQLSFKNGSIGTIHYFSNGHKAYPKENLTIFCNGKVIELNNFKSTKSFGTKHHLKSFSQDKGHLKCCESFFNTIALNSKTGIPFEQIYESSLFAIKANQ